MCVCDGQRTIRRRLSAPTTSVPVSELSSSSWAIQLAENSLNNTFVWDVVAITFNPSALEARGSKVQGDREGRGRKEKREEKRW